MKVEVEPGKYVLAVSGGVDSVVLLDLLSKKQELDLIVAYFNHGIREESAADEELVKRLAHRHGVPFEVGRAYLGENASEEVARRARYGFLHSIVDKHHAKAIITAHHQDDLIETAFINLLRGTGRRGLIAIKSNRQILRPLLDFPKTKLIDYALQNNLEWREDTTNNNENLLRNYLRKNITTKLTDKQKARMLKNIEKVAKNNHDIEVNIANLSHYLLKDHKIIRQRFAALPSNLGDEFLAYWLRQNHLKSFDKKTVNRLNIALKAAKPNTIYPVQGNLRLQINQKAAQLSSSL